MNATCKLDAKTSFSLTNESSTNNSIYHLESVSSKLVHTWTSDTHDETPNIRNYYKRLIAHFEITVLIDSILSSNKEAHKSWVEKSKRLNKRKRLSAIVSDDLQIYVEFFSYLLALAETVWFYCLWSWTNVRNQCDGWICTSSNWNFKDSKFSFSFCFHLLKSQLSSADTQEFGLFWPAEWNRDFPPSNRHSTEYKLWEFFIGIKN